MKVSVCVPSRGRPFRALHCLKTLWHLRSGENEIEFILGLDEDDDTAQMTMALIEDCGFPVTMLYMEPAATLGGKCNRLLYVGTGDYLTVMGDRCICTTLGWDIPIVNYMVPDTRVRWWTGMNEGSFEAPVFSRRWVEACNRLFSGVFPDLFPFWYIDTWTRDLDALVSCDVPVHIASRFVNPRREPSIGARDLKFWAQFYADLHGDREEWAIELWQDFGIEPTEKVNEVSRVLEDRAVEAVANAEKWEARFGDPSPPDALYLAAKKRAENILNGKEDI